MRHGRRVRAGGVDLFRADSPTGRPRAGVVVPLHGRSAAARNRLRRRLREIARRDLLPRAFAAGVAEDLVLRARPDAYGRSYRSLRDPLLEAYRPGEGSEVPPASASGGASCSDA